MVLGLGGWWVNDGVCRGFVGRFAGGCQKVQWLRRWPKRDCQVGLCIKYIRSNEGDGSSGF